jgi:hypothetical protein
VFEPLTKLTFSPEEAKLRRCHLPEEAELSLVVLSEAYADLLCETNIERIVDRLVESGGVRLVAVEGGEGRLTVQDTQAYAGRGIANLVESRIPISAGVAHLMHGSPRAFEVWGVDHEELRQRQVGTMSRVLAAQSLVRTWFAGLDAALAGVRARVPSHVPDPASGMLDRAEWIARELRRMGIDVAGYPALSKLLRIRELEAEIDAKTAETQRNRLIRDLVEKALGWWKISGRLVTFDPELLEPVVWLWLRKTGRSQADLESQIAAEGLEKTLLACRDWIQAWLFRSALDARSGSAPMHEYYEDLILLALGLGIEVLPLRDFRRHVLTLKLSHHLDLQQCEAEAGSCREMILEALCKSPEEERLLGVERRLEMLSTAWRLELRPETFDRFLTVDRSLRSLAAEIGELAGDAGARPPDPGPLEALGDEVFRFYSLSRQRGQHMLETALGRMRETGQERAVLVCGGFHVDVIVSHLERRYPDVAWSLVQPQLDFGRAENGAASRSSPGRLSRLWHRLKEMAPWR